MDSVTQLSLGVGFFFVCYSLCLCKLTIDFNIMERRISIVEKYRRRPVNPVVVDNPEDPV